MVNAVPETLDKLEGAEHQNAKAKAAVILVRMLPGDIKALPERRSWATDGVMCFSKICTHVGCPINLYEQQTHKLLCPCHQSTFDLADNGKVLFGPAARPLPQLPIMVDDRGLSCCTERLHRGRRAEFLGARMSQHAPSMDGNGVAPGSVPDGTTHEPDGTLTGHPAMKALAAPRSGSTTARGIAKSAKAQLRKVFPDHWSFLLGEIVLYSFILLLLSGVFLTLWFKPSMEEVVYSGSYAPLTGVHMSEAFASTLHMSFDVRGGLLLRQIHHWGALIFMAAMTLHMLRIFFTGAFRRPREINWLLGLVLINLGFLEGFAGYSLPDDLLSGTGLRVAEGMILSAAGRRVPTSRSSSSAASSLAPTSSRACTPCTSCWSPGSCSRWWRCTSCWSSTSSTPSTRARAAPTRTSSATRSSRCTWPRPAASSSPSAVSSC